MEYAIIGPIPYIMLTIHSTDLGDALPTPKPAAIDKNDSKLLSFHLELEPRTLRVSLNIPYTNYQSHFLAAHAHESSIPNISLIKAEIL